MKCIRKRYLIKIIHGKRILCRSIKTTEKTPNSLKPDWGRMSTSTGYPVVYCPDHPRAWSTGYVYAHVLAVERRLNRFLRKEEVVHHKDENRFNFCRRNLTVKLRSKHSKDHGLSNGRKMVTLCCPACRKTFERYHNMTFLTKGRGSFTCCSKRCRGIFSKMVYLNDKRVPDRMLSNVIKTYISNQT